MEESDLKGPQHSFIRNARVAIAIWVTLSIILTVLVFTALLVPYWLGHGPGAFTPGHMGLYQSCIFDGSQASRCTGSATDLANVGNVSFQAATVLMILACLFCILALVVVPFMFFFSTWRILAVGGVAQAVVAALIFFTCIVFPSGWDDARVRNLCGSSAEKFRLGTCRMRWAFPLAIITLLDALAVACLALVIANVLYKIVGNPNAHGPKLQYNTESSGRRPSPTSFASGSRKRPDA